MAMSSHDPIALRVASGSARQRPRRRLHRIASAALATALVLCAPALAQAQAKAGQSTERRLPRVTPTTGASWLEVRGTSMEVSAMGREGHSSNQIPDWVATHAQSELIRSVRPDPPDLTEVFTLTGADIFRLSCRSCHAADGSGSPPEVKSLIDPIRATSARLQMERMEALGRPIPRAMADTLASQAKQKFLQRLHHGGQRMPVFNHLADDEVDALFGYLERLAKVPGAPEKPARLNRSVTRVGELLVKGTCHTCHAAAGRGGGPEVLKQGIIPSLDTFSEQKLPAYVVRKVTEGAPIDPTWSARGKMPVFNYLTGDEVRAAYTYLLLYPPHK